MSAMYSSALAITSISAQGRRCDSVFDSASSEIDVLAEHQRRRHHALDAAGLADDRGGLRAFAGLRDHHHQIGAVDLVDQVLGAAGEIAEPAGEALALATVVLAEGEAVKNVAPFQLRCASDLTTRSLGRSSAITLTARGREFGASMR